MAQIPSKNLLEPGDILLLKDEPTNTTFKHKLIKLGQAMTSLNMKRESVGDSSFVHALLWTKNGKNNEPDIAEASGSGSVRTFNPQPGLYAVYRPLDGNVGDWAAQVALMWAVGGTIAYAKRAALLSISHSDSFGPKGKARSAVYAKEAFSNSPEWGSGGAFCSQFVLACYQAAAGQLKKPLTGALQTDALHCSVRALHDRLIRDAAGHLNFKQEGSIRIAGDGH
jgi:hypothetical protein